LVILTPAEENVTPKGKARLNIYRAGPKKASDENQLIHYLMLLNPLEAFVKTVQEPVKADFALQEKQATVF